jgi:excisionase family DNA binding protein
MPTRSSIGYFEDRVMLAKRLETVMEDRWLSVDEIAVYLGIKRDTVYKWIAEKRIPACKIGRLWKFKKGEVDEWVQSRQSKQTERQH